MQGKNFVSSFFIFGRVSLNLYVILQFLWNESKFVEYRFIGQWMLIGILVELWLTIQRLINIKYVLSSPTHTHTHTLCLTIELLKASDFLNLNLRGLTCICATAGRI